MNLLHPVRRLFHSFNNHGLPGMLRRSLLRSRAGRDRGPADFITPVEPHPFDLRHGTDTSGYLPGEALQSGHAAADFCNTAYYGISPSTLESALSHLPEPPQDFTFVDLGCGKGRALLIAAAHGFRGVLGVELSPALCEVARCNAAGHGNIQVLACDASEVSYPPGPLVVFLYHPFLAPLLRRALRNLQRQLAAAPRCCYLLYANPACADLVNRSNVTPLWNRTFALSPEDAAADRHGIACECYSLWRLSA